MSTMSEPEHYRLSLASSKHLETLAALMAQDDIDFVSAADETIGGVPYVVIVVQGHFTQYAEHVAKVVSAEIERLRRLNQEEAERG